MSHMLLCCANLLIHCLPAVRFCNPNNPLIPPFWSAQHSVDVFVRPRGDPVIVVEGGRQLGNWRVMTNAGASGSISRVCKCSVLTIAYRWH